jgi:glycosyltransferase involved in cell wall biosynthesis
VRISAVIPTHNRRERTVEAVESVLSQTLRPDEVIVVDDGSTDDTPSAVARFGDALTLIRQEHSGVSAARNRGIGASSGDWLAFLDSDDLWEPGKLQAQMKALDTHSDYRIVYTDEKWIKDGRYRNQGKRHAKHSGWIYERCLPLCIISPSSVLVHRCVFDTVGLFDDQLPACEDYDMWLRVCARFPVLYLPEKLTVKRAGDWPQLSAQHSLDRYRIIALTKILEGGALSHWQRPITLDMLREKVLIYARGCRKHAREDEAAWAEAQVPQD